MIRKVSTALNGASSIVETSPAAATKAATATGPAAPGAAGRGLRVAAGSEATSSASSSNPFGMVENQAPAVHSVPSLRI